MIIPHPSFNVNDLIHLEVIDSLITDTECVSSQKEETLDDSILSDMKEAILSFIGNGQPLSHFHTILLPVWFVRTSPLEIERIAVDLHRYEPHTSLLLVDCPVLRVCLQFKFLFLCAAEAILSSARPRSFGAEPFEDSLRPVGASSCVQRCSSESL